MADTKVIQSIHTSKGKYPGYIPFILAMVDRELNLQTLPYPSQEGQSTTDIIYGIELFVNPTSISNNMSKIITRTQTMTAFVEEHWGEELDTITFQGSTATFVNGGSDIYAVRMYDSPASPIVKYYGFAGAGTNSVRDDVAPGVTTSKRRESVSYQQFLRIVDLFRSNGCTFDQNGFVKNRYYVLLSFGTEAYRGFFESIDVTEDASNPFRFIYTITFKAEETAYSYTDPGRTFDIPIAQDIQAREGGTG